MDDYDIDGSLELRCYALVAWQQHDVQELMRVMFDALERKWKDTPQADLINKLYQGRSEIQTINESFSCS